MTGLRAGDIVFAKGNVLVRWATRSKGEPLTEAGHTGLMVDPVNIVEALSRVMRRLLTEGYAGKVIAIYRPTGLTHAQVYAIVKKAEDYVGRPYGWTKIVAHGIDRFLGGAYLARRLAGMDRYPICSWVVAHAYKAAGLNFGVPPGMADPDDIWDFVTTHPDKYECIWPLGKWEP